MTYSDAFKDISTSSKVHIKERVRPFGALDSVRRIVWLSAYTIPQTHSLAGMMAEVEGFEPPVPCGTTVFKTVALDRSATPPRWIIADTMLRNTGFSYVIIRLTYHREAANETPD